MYRKSVIKTIGEMVGRVIKLDDNTGSALRGKFVRLAIMVDLYKPLVSKIKVDGWERIGDDVDLNLGTRSSGSKVNHEEAKEFGPWMLVDRRLRKVDRSKGSGKDVKESANLMGSHFNVLLNLRNNGIDAEKSTDQRNPSTLKMSLDRGKSNKFKSRGSRRLPISEAMSRIVDDIERVATNSISEAKEGSKLVMDGCASPKFIKVVNDYFVEHEVVIAVFLETWVSGPKAEKIIAKLGIDFSYRVEAQGFSGGVWVCWRSGIQIQVLNNNPQFIHSYIKNEMEVQGAFVTFVYGSPDKRK
ncbi:hypothetical protein Gorai_018995, partial [Gossypium raimondii]|nr:hypothetical protein [Gossypium raimondii]